jgi:signal peptidase I
MSDVTPTFPSPSRTSLHWGRSFLAGFLSFLIPGSGQLYNGHVYKAVWMALILWSLTAIFTITHAFMLSFGTLLGAIVILWCGRLLILADAAYAAARIERPHRPGPRILYAAVAMTLVLMAIYPSSEQLKGWTGFSAFLVPSKSMCPTICEGERIVADRNAYKKNLPKRGDLVLVKHQLFNELVIKRLVGVPGDLVSTGPNNIVLVNAIPVVTPAICGKPPASNEAVDLHPTFEAVKVPDGKYFVLGDNLDNSFDSRFSQFGFVQGDEIKGKPLFLYWSRSFSRIGCRAL